MKERESATVLDSWQAEHELGQVHLWGETYGLHLRTRTQTGVYEPAPRETLVPLTTSGRQRETIGQVYILEPRLSPLAHWRRLTHQPLQTRPRALDTVRIGDVHAISYDQEQTIVLWDCSLLPAYQEAEPVLDPNLRALWQGIEAHLVQQHPATIRLVTPAWDPSYAVAEYRAFLADRGYAPLSPHAFAKSSNAVLPAARHPTA